LHAIRLRSKQKLKMYLIIDIVVNVNKASQAIEIKENKKIAFARERKEQKELFRLILLFLLILLIARSCRSIAYIVDLLL